MEEIQCTYLETITKEPNSTFYLCNFIKKENSCEKIVKHGRLYYCGKELKFDKN